MLLYNRCKTWRTLPRAGGILDQDPLLMDIFDRIEAKVAAAQKRQQEQATRPRR